MKVYLVTTNGVERLIEARNKNQALAHAVSTTMEVALAGQVDLIRLVSAGVAVESSVDAAGE